MSGRLQMLFLVGCVALVSAGEEQMSPSEVDPHHHVTTVCIQVHGISSALCGPEVKPEAARGAQQFAQAEAARGAQQFAPAEAARGAGLQMPVAEAARGSQFPAAAFRNSMAAGPPSDAVLQGFIENVPVYRMRSADEMQKPHNGQPCPEPPSRASSGSVTVVQPPNYGLHSPLIGGFGGLGGLGQLGSGGGGSVVTVQQPLQGYLRSPEAPSARTIPFAPFGVEPQQQIRASQFAGGRSQQLAAVRAAANAADCDDNKQFAPQMRGAPVSSFQGPQQQMRQVFVVPQAQPQAYPSMRASPMSADDYLAKQCAEQEKEIKRKSEEISDLKRQLDRLSSSMTEKTTVEQKTVAVKSASPSDSQKEHSEEVKPKEPLKKKK